MSASSLCGIIIPGRPVIIDFEQIEEFKFFSNIENPSNIPDITFFLLPSSDLPSNSVLMLYYSVEPYNDWTLIGSIDNGKPSAILRTGWSTDEAVMRSDVVRVGISLESVDDYFNLEDRQRRDIGGIDDRRFFALQIAKNAYDYLSSYLDEGSCQGIQNLLSQWVDRFEQKLKFDPNFFMKIS